VQGGGGEGDVVIAFGESTLAGVEEGTPLFPREFEGAGELFDVARDAEAAEGVRVGEGVGAGGCAVWGFGSCAHGEVENGFLGFSGKMGGNVEDGFFVGVFDGLQPFRGNAVAE
jgi:hypothetical protein